jgi:glucosyl-dolichyl phosphate glucuronosyltransferase
MRNFSKADSLGKMFDRQLGSHPMTTIILCTYNRCQSLAKALESVTALRLPESDQWEVLVVDNNSSDHTREVVEDFRCRYPGRIRHIFEPRQGKSYALNTGIQDASGDVLAFMDDDVTVEPTWLQNLTAPLRDSEWAGAGGRIIPQWDSPPPPWLPLDSRYRSAPLALFDLGLGAGPLIEPPFGTNMAFKRVMFEKYGWFRTDLGPNPDNLIRGEDTEFGSRLLAAGERLRYEPTAVVYHPVSAYRFRKEYYLAWWFDKARADVRQSGFGVDRICCWGIPLVLFRRLAVWTLRWMLTIDAPVRFQCKLNVWINAGAISEYYCRYRAKGPWNAERQAESEISSVISER